MLRVWRSHPVAVHVKTAARAVELSGVSALEGVWVHTVQYSFHDHRKMCVLLQPGDVLPADGGVYCIGDIHSQATVIAIAVLRKGQRGRGEVGHAVHTRQFMSIPLPPSAADFSSYLRCGGILKRLRTSSSLFPRKGVSTVTKIAL